MHQEPFAHHTLSTVLMQIYAGMSVYDREDDKVRHGFIRITPSGVFTADRYAMPDQIESVSDNRVTLGVTYAELMHR